MVAEWPRDPCLAVVHAPCLVAPALTSTALVDCKLGAQDHNTSTMDLDTRSLASVSHYSSLPHAARCVFSRIAFCEFPNTLLPAWA